MPDPTEGCLIVFDATVIVLTQNKPLGVSLLHATTMQTEACFKLLSGFMTARSYFIATERCQVRLDSLVFTFRDTQAVLARISAHHTLRTCVSFDGAAVHSSEVVVVHLGNDAGEIVYQTRVQVVGVYRY